jgi:hypothetical protein
MKSMCRELSTCPLRPELFTEGTSDPQFSPTLSYWKTVAGNSMTKYPPSLHFKRVFHSKRQSSHSRVKESRATQVIQTN